MAELDPGQDDESIGELLGRLVDDGKSYARAEIGYYRTLAAAKIVQARTGVLLGLAAAILALAAVGALLVGLILTLAPLVGTGSATLIVIAAALLLAALLGWLAYRHFRRMFAGR